MSRGVDESLAERLRAADSADEAAREILDYLHEYGDRHYDEAVTQRAHALQAAQHARADRSTPELVVAALLHDLGHLLLRLDRQASDDALAADLDHEGVAADYLQPFFPPEVTEPIRLHVAAKRYMCAARPEYLQQLSPASVRSLEVQGGPFSDEERAAFESHPHFEDAVRLRRWDDEAKVVGGPTPPVESFQTEVASSLLRH